MVLEQLDNHMLKKKKNPKTNNKKTQFSILSSHYMQKLTQGES